MAEQNYAYLKRVSRRNIEEILEETVGKRYGNRFTFYRSEYARTVSGQDLDNVPDYPLTLSIETVNRCNLACIMCHLPHFLKPKTTLDMDDLRKLFTEAEQMGVPAINIGNGHEPLLYKDVDAMIDEAVNHKIMDLLLFTNGHLLTKARVDKLLEAGGVTRVFISLDAATEETYNIIRASRAKTAAGAQRLAEAEANIRYLVQRRDELGLQLPVVRVSFVLQEENKHEVDAFRKRWIDIVDAVDFQREGSHAGIEVMELLDEEERWKERELGTHLKRMRPEERYCHYPFDTLAIWSDGNVGPCCAYQGKNIPVGNIREQTLQEIWHGEKMQRLRKQHREGKLNVVCQQCLEGQDFSILRDQKTDN